MLTLITGSVGAGKSALLSRLVHTEYAPRAKIFTHGIEWSEPRQANIQPVKCSSSTCLSCPALPPGDYPDAGRWMDYLIPGAVFVFDEAHHVWPQRKKEDAPQSVVRLRESRHLGVDFVISTQAPMFLDIDVRRLVNSHIHLIRAGVGRLKKTWSEYQDEPVKTPCGDVVPYLIDKAYFSKYKSADFHTDAKPPIAFKYKIAAAALFLIVALISVQVYRFDGFTAGVDVQQPVAKLAATGALPRPSVSSDFSFSPVVIDTPVISAPVIAACLSTPTRCTCYNHQAKKIPVETPICLDFVDGFYRSNALYSR